MCHLLLLLPILALPVFWLWPASVSVPVYGLVVVCSVAVYLGVVRAMRKPVLTGMEHMSAATGEVVGRSGARLTVSVGAELWTAEAVDTDVEVGDHVRVVGTDGLKLRVAREPRRTSAGPPRDAAGTSGADPRRDRRPAREP